jgi:16S rRNA (guanine966-N2)-methyltransferase
MGSQIIKKQNLLQNRVRIIGGKYRGRFFPFPNLPHLRPTPNRIRETLFNWLTPIIIDAKCLDVFAGSGALGLEALSRGAASTTFIDADPEIVNCLTRTIAQFHSKTTTTSVRPSLRGSIAAAAIQKDPEINTEVLCLSIPCPLVSKQPFNIVFLDPPFGQNLIQPACQWLETQQLLAENALIYIETEKNLTELPIPTHWKILKNKTAGKVNYYLVQLT